MSPTLLAIETSTEACSVAVCHRDRIESEHEVVPRQHNRWVLRMIERVLARAGAARTDIDAIAFGCGPGSFTGTRIAASVAQGLALAVGRPIVPVSRPDVLAHTAWLEPIMKVVVETPTEYQGPVMGSLNKMRGMIVGSQEDGPMSVIEAKVPLAQMFGYSTVIRSLTQGKAQFTMEFDSYKQVPVPIADELIKKKNEEKAQKR